MDALPKPYFQADGITIYHGDCADLLLLLPVFDLVLTDPPYGHGSKWEGGSWASDPMYQEALEWDAQPVALELLGGVISKAPRSIIWGGNYYVLPPSRCWLAWEKAEKMETLADLELAWMNLDRPAKMFKARRNQDGKREHPTAKPERLMRWCIEQAGNGVATIIDPFMGSGKTLLAARNLGRSAVGIEIRERYCEVAAQSLSQGVLAL